MKRSSVRTVPMRLLTVAVISAGMWLAGGGSEPAVTRASTPATGYIDTTTPSTSWDFAPVSGTNLDTGSAAIQCPSGQCDNFDLTLGQPPAGYQATLTINYTWNSLTPTDLDVWAIAPNNTASGPGSPDDVSVGAGGENLTIDAAAPGLYHIRSVAAITPVATAAHAVATVTYSAATGGPTYSGTSIAFAPATIVDASFTGAEPQLTLERPIKGALSGATDPNRGFIDWPLSSRTNTGMLHRTTNGGDSFRPLLDLQCALRNRPNCLTGGGGDTVNRVNLYDGTVYFGDQEGVANEALATSTDHGDTFPDTRQYAVSNADAGVDRQWISTVNAGGVMGGPTVPLEVRGFYSYHIPAAGEYIQGIDASGTPIPQPVPQLLSVSQSGPSRVDMEPKSLGKGYIYQCFRDSGGFKVAAARISSYQDPAAWKVGTVSADQPALFPWINLDTAGNLYAVWATGGAIYYSYSLIGDPANNPAAGGTPASKWSPKIRVSMPSVTSAVFPEVVAGSPGRVAILYDGTTDPGASGASDNAPAGATWYPYVAIMTNGTSGTSPTISTGQASHRVVHVGSICTSGTTCTGDRSLLDMIDVQIDSEGRVGAVFTDNNNQFARDTGSSSAKGQPFVKFAKLTSGPSLYAHHPPINVSIPSGSRSSAAGDATWPNTSSGTNLPSLDELGAAFSHSGNQVVGRIDLADATQAQRLADINTYNSYTGLGGPAQRLLYVFRYETASDVYYLAFEQNQDGSTRCLGGKLNGTDGITNGTTALAVGYHTQAGIAVNCSFSGSSLYLSGPDSSLGVGAGTPVYSVSAFSMAGPSEASELTILDVMRTIDATPPFDATG